MQRLTPATETDADTRAICILNHWTAIDSAFVPLTRENAEALQLRLRKSQGRRKAGRPTKYYLFGSGLSLDAPVIEAYSDEEAITAANELLEAT